LVDSIRCLCTVSTFVDPCFLLAVLLNYMSFFGFLHRLQCSPQLCRNCSVHHLPIMDSFISLYFASPNRSPHSSCEFLSRLRKNPPHFARRSRSAKLFHCSVFKVRFLDVRL